MYAGSKLGGMGMSNSGDVSVGEPRPPCATLSASVMDGSLLHVDVRDAEDADEGSGATARLLLLLLRDRCCF